MWTLMKITILCSHIFNGAFRNNIIGFILICNFSVKLTVALYIMVLYDGNFERLPRTLCRKYNAIL